MSEQLKGHGHVTPNADGFLARCGGPSICKVCKAELAALKAQEPVGYQLPPFAQKVIRKLERFQECTDDGQGADIGRHWFDLLTQLGLLNRVQRSPALWEITQQGEDLLAAAPAAPDSQKVDVNMVLPCDIKLPGGMMIGKGCKLSTLLLSFRNRGDDAAWRQRFSVPVPYDPVLLSIRPALAKAEPGADQ